MPGNETNNRPEIVGIEVSRSEGVVPFMPALDIKDTSPHSSDSYVCEAFRKFLLYLSYAVSGTPTNVLVEVEFLNPVDGQWYKYRQGLFAALYESADSVGSGIRVCYSGECLGREMRVTITGTDTTGSAYFTVRPCVEFMN